MGDGGRTAARDVACRQLPARIVCRASGSVDPSSRALLYLKFVVGLEVRRSGGCDWIMKTRRCEVVHATLV